MPSYDYVKEATGERVELIVPIAQRDQVPGHRRVAVPPKLNTVGFAEDIHSTEYGVREGLKDMENRYGRGRMERETQMSMKALQDTWAN